METYIADVPVGRPSYTFNFLASLINGNLQSASGRTFGLFSFNFLASLINGNILIWISVVSMG